MLNSYTYSRNICQIKILHKLLPVLHIHRRANAHSNSYIRSFHKGNHRWKKEVYKDESDQPVFKYSAFTESPGMSRTMDTIDPPIEEEQVDPLRRISVLVSFAVFGWYWFYYREEHHIDKILGGDVYDQLPKMELQHLEGVKQAMTRAGVDTLEVDARIKFLEEEEERKTAELEAMKAGKELPKLLPEVERLKTSIEKMKQEGIDTTSAEERLKLLMKRSSKNKDNA